MIRLSELIAQSGISPEAVSGDADIVSITSDSRQVTGDSLFVCMPGNNVDGHKFLAQAKAAGASAAVTYSVEGHRAAATIRMPTVRLANDRNLSASIGRLVAAFHSFPTRAMTVIGVTGTNGKSTTAWLLRDMLAAVGRKPAYIGTLGFSSPAGSRLLENTTPLPVELNNLIALAKSDGADSLAMEVSSHALEERRADAVEFDAAVFTNLTQDHLDFHGSMEAYEAAKFRIFTDLPKMSSKKFVAAINADDPVGQSWLQSVETPTITYGFESGDLRGQQIEVKVDRLRLLLKYGGTEIEAVAALGGAYNVSNCLSAAAGFLALGYPIHDAAKALGSVRPVPGRFEAVPNGLGFGVLVDYAHTPDALEKLLEAVRILDPKRIITVFGCGGDRDKNKRPKMAAAVSENSDKTIITSDNPRTEDPQTIIDEVAAGLAPGSDSAQIVDRREAIRHAIEAAVPGDIVVIAGKGHENYQIIGRTKYPMDDRVIAREALEARR